MKKLLFGGAVAIVVIVVMIVVLLSKLDAIVAKVIEKEGGAVTGTTVSVSGVSISLREGRGSIKGLRVASPDGFAERTAFALDDITIGIAIKSLRKSPVVIDEIRIRAPVVNAELTKTGGSNIEQLSKRVEAYSSAAPRKGGETKRIRIDRFVFEQGRVEIDASALGLGKRTIALPEIRLSDVGGPDGALPDELARIILTAFAHRVTSEIADSEINRLVKDKVGGSLTSEARGLLDKLRK